MNPDDQDKKKMEELMKNIHAANEGWGGDIEDEFAMMSRAGLPVQLVVTDRGAYIRLVYEKKEPKK